jgi:hypothetical protein
VKQEGNHGKKGGMKAGCPVAGDKGSVLMEYVVMSCVIASAIIAFWHMELYNPRTGWQEGTKIPGTEKRFWLGRGTVEFYQRVLGSIALPVP